MFDPVSLENLEQAGKMLSEKIINEFKADVDHRRP